MSIPALLLLEAQAVREGKGPSPSCLDENLSPDGASAGHSSEQQVPGQRNFHCYYQIFIKSNRARSRAQAVCAERGCPPGLRQGPEVALPPSGLLLRMSRHRDTGVRAERAGGNGHWRGSRGCWRGDQGLWRGNRRNKPSSVHSRSQTSLMMWQPLFPVSPKPHSGAVPLISTLESCQGALGCDGW